MTRELRCTAGHLVGVERDTADGVLVVLQHRGREYRFYGALDYARCQCGGVWWRGVMLPLEGLERKMPTLAGR